MDEKRFDESFPFHCLDVDCKPFVDHINPVIITLFELWQFAENIFVNYRLSENPSELILIVSVKLSSLCYVVDCQVIIDKSVNVCRNLNVFHFFRLE